MKKSEYTESPWLWKGDIIDPELIYDGTYGFVYLLENPQRNVSYIGKKNLVRYDRRGKILGESNWMTYFSSSKEVKDILKETGYGEWQRHILAFAYTKRQLSYLETKYLFTYEVLERDDFLNKSIAGKYFKGNLI